MTRLTSKLTQISKPLLTGASVSNTSKTAFKRSLPYTINDASSQRYYKRGLVNQNQSRMKSVLVGNGRRNYSTETAEQKQESFSEQIQKRAVTNTPKNLGANLTGSHIRPMVPGHDGRVFGYFMLGTNRAVVSTGIRLLVLKLLYSWSANARVMALASVEVDLAPIPPGKTITITFRGKPVFIKHRTPKEIAAIKADESNLSVFRDPELDTDRFPLNPDWTVVLAICTHLGCVPVTDAGRWGAFFCPCHGSHYDASGRIRAGPAPLNLAVPPMKFSESNTLILG